MQKSFNWSKIGAVLAGLAMVGAVGAPFIANNGVDNIQEQLDDLNTKIVIDEEGQITNVADVIVGENAITNQDIYDNLIEEDMFEGEAEALAMEELEDDDYEELADRMGIDEDDIEEVVVKDIDVKKVDVDDRDAEVVIELKVYYEDENGRNKHKHVKVIATIEDNEVEGDLVFSEIRN